MASVVDSLHNLSKHSEDATYPTENMREDLAKAWANGENNVQKRVLAAGETDHTWAEKQVYDMAGKGMGVERAVKGFELCLQTLRALVTELDQAPTAEEASNIWGAYDKSLDKYWDFVRELTSKLKDAGIRKYLGKIFKALFEAHLRAFEIIRTKMVANVGPKIDTKRKFQTERLPGYNRPPPTDYYQTPEKLQEWGERTIGYLQEGLKAASG